MRTLLATAAVCGRWLVGYLRDTLVRLFLEGQSPEQIAGAHPKPKFRSAILEATTGAILTQAGRTYALWLFQQSPPGLR